jgi:hypothetical protein
MTIGIEWVNNYLSASSNLSNNDDNARGFYNRLHGQRVFESSDDLAWDQDFEEKGAGAPPAGTDQLYADHVDIVRADAEGTDTFNDHWHGKGFVSSDPRNPTVLSYLRESC